MNYETMSKYEFFIVDEMAFWETDCGKTSTNNKKKFFSSKQNVSHSKQLNLRDDDFNEAQTIFIFVFIILYHLNS